jgi:MFS family permease
LLFTINAFFVGMVFGSFVGGMADWGGRRTFVILYSVFYALSCMTKRKLFCMIYVYGMEQLPLLQRSMLIAN